MEEKISKTIEIDNTESSEVILDYMRERLKERSLPSVGLTWRGFLINT